MSQNIYIQINALILNFLFIKESLNKYVSQFPQQKKSF